MIQSDQKWLETDTTTRPTSTQVDMLMTTTRTMLITETTTSRDTDATRQRSAGHARLSDFDKTTLRQSLPYLSSHRDEHIGRSNSYTLLSAANCNASSNDDPPSSASLSLFDDHMLPGDTWSTSFYSSIQCSTLNVFIHHEWSSFVACNSRLRSAINVWKMKTSGPLSWNFPW